MEPETINNIYLTLIGELCDEYRMSGVENLFAAGSECDRLYAQIFESYARLRERLGSDDEDEDVEIIINSFMRIEKLVAIRMFEYGRKFSK